MKKLNIVSQFLLIVVPFVLLVITTSRVGAVGADDNAGDKNIPATPTGNLIKNKNQVETKNQGEDSQLQVNTQEQENFGDEGGSGSENRNQNAEQNMSQVAQKVQELLQIRTEGGIGEQVREVARLQNQSQTQVETQLDKLDSKSKISRFFTGTNLNAVQILQQELEQNRVRIRQLEQIQGQLTEEGDKTLIREVIQVMNNQNISLEERVLAEEQVKSLFGWLIKLLSN